MATSEDNDVASRQLGWLRKVREAVNLTGPPPPEVLRCLAPPSEDDISQEDGKTASSERQKEPISPLSPKVVEELASLRWELQERQRTVSSLEELVDLLQTRCRELEDESRELVDLAASKHEQEQLEAGVPHERRDEDDYIATIKERQLSREPIPPLGRSSIRSNLSSERDLEMERLKLRCEELEEERMGLEMQLEESKAQGSSLAATLKQSGINVAGAKGNDSESEDAEKDWSREDLEARCLRLEAEKEKLQKHVERLWQMCEALDASAKPEEQQLQGRQGSLEELNFEAVVERAVSMKATERQQLARAEAEKAELQELAEALTAQVQALQERLRSEDQEVSIGAVARCEDLTRQKAELEKELGELATAYAKLQGNLNAEKRLRLEAEEALQLERKALEEAQALEDRGVQSEPKKVAEREAEPESNLEALRQELAALAAERDQLRSKVLSRVPKAVETQLQHAEAAVEEQMQRVTQAEAVAEEQKQLRFQAEAELEEQALLKRRLEASLKEETHLRSKVEAQLAEQIQLRSQAEAYLDAERLAREEVLRQSMETSRASITTQEELQKQAEALAIETEKCRVLGQQNAGLQEEMAQLVETQRTLEATSAIKLEGLQEKYNELQAQVSSDQAERSSSLEKEVASLRKQIEEMVSEQAMSEELLGTDTVEELKADIVKLTEEQGRLEAECERRNAQKEELVLQLEEALRAETRKTEELKEMQQKLRGAEEAKEEVDGKAASLRQQLQCSQAEGDMLSNELQKLGQQLQDAQANAVSLQDEYDLLRGRYETLEADHTDLGLRAEEALAGHQALTAEHQRVVDQAKHLQQRHSTEDEGLRQSHQLLSAEIIQVKAERDMLQKQVKQQEAYTESRQANLMADADRLRDETLARAEEWKSMVAELSGLRNSRTALETRCNSLMDKAQEAEEECQKHKGIAESSRAESEALKSELQQLQKSALDAASKQQVTAEEAERLRREASEIEASRLALQREVEEYRRQGETWQMEQGVLEADASRLFAANEALMKENEELLARVQALAPKASSEEAYMARISEAEQWVLYHAGMPLEGNSMPYLSGVVISFQDFFTPLAPLVLASSPAQLRSAAAAIQSGELARVSLQCFRLCDSERRGSLSWEAEEVSDLVDAVFQRRGLPAPTKDLQRLIFMQFDKEFSGRLSAQDCLCLVDALFRALLISPAALSARVAEAPEGPIVTGRGPRRSTGQEEARQLAESIAQARLQSRLHEAERAAERAVATVGPAGPVGGFLPEPIAAPLFGCIGSRT